MQPYPAKSLVSRTVRERGASRRATGSPFAPILTIAVLMMICVAALSCGGGGVPGKVLVIALDGATWDVIDPMIEQGRLPNIAKMRESGAHGPLQSIEPTLSPAIFTTIATGKSPREHGILRFTRRAEDASEVSYTNADRRVRAIWNILSDRNRRVNVVGWFTTWPADIVEGAFISDRSEGPLAGGNWPESLETMLARTGDALSEEQAREGVERFYGPEPGEGGLPEDEERSRRSIEEAMVHYYRVDVLRLEWALELMKEDPADLTMVFFKGIDPASHLTWAYMDPQPFEGAFEMDPEAQARLATVIPRYYEYMDEAIGRLAAAAPAGCEIVLLSDHGFGASPAQLAYHLNPVLARLGWVKADESDHPDPARSIVIDPTPQGKNGKRDRRLVVNRELLHGKAADPAGRRQVVEEMAEQLRALRSDKGLALLEKVAVVEGSEGGQSDERYAIDLEVNEAWAPDRDGGHGTEPEGTWSAEGQTWPLTDLVTLRKEHTGAHHLDGILLLSGPRVRPGMRIEGATVYDIAPTLLRLLGLPAAKDMRGRALEEAFEADLVPPAGTIASYERDEAIARVEPPAQPEVEEELQQRLRTLGYIQ